MTRRLSALRWKVWLNMESASERRKSMRAWLHEMSADEDLEALAVKYFVQQGTSGRKTWRGLIDSMTMSDLVSCLCMVGSLKPLLTHATDTTQTISSSIGIADSQGAINLELRYMPSHKVDDLVISEITNMNMETTFKNDILPIAKQLFAGERDTDDDATTPVNASLVAAKMHAYKDVASKDAMLAYIELNAAAGQIDPLFAGVASKTTRLVAEAMGETDSSTITTEEPAHMSATTATAPTITIDPNLSKAIDALLGPATGGKFATLSDMVRQMGEATTAAADAQRKATELASRLAKTPSVPMPTTIPGDGKLPNGKIEMVRAIDVFSGPRGKKAKALEFEIPKFVWDAPHPLVPTIDPNYKFRLKHLLKVLWALSNRQNIWLYGHSGTGKTTLIEQIAAYLQWPVMRINLDSGIERSDIVGHTGLVSEAGTTVSKFIEGIAPKAMAQGAILLVDECDYGRPDVMYAIQRVLEHKGLLLTEDNARVVTPHPYFRIVATANTRGQGDEFGVYPGARVQSIAFRNRFNVWVEVEYLDEAEEQQLLLDNYPTIDKNDAGLFVKLANEIRTAFKGGEIMETASPRDLLALGHMFVDFHSLIGDRKAAVELAIDTVIVSKVTGDAQAKVREIYKRVFA